MSINFDLNDLQAFRAVVEQGNFRRAAEAIRITQPALSRRIEKLEAALNVKLFERTTRKVNLTTVGRAFLPQVETMLDNLDVALMRISEVGSSRMGSVTVACVPSAAYYFMPRAISEFQRQYPKIKVKLIDASANDVSAAVTAGEAEFGVSFSGNLAPEVEFDLLLEERYVLACRQDHPLAGKTGLSWQDVSQYPFITLDKTSGNRLVIDRALNRANIEQQSVCEVRHVTTLIGLVEAGLGIALVPSIAMPQSPHHLLTSVEIAEPKIARSMGIIKRRGRTLTPAALALEALLRAHSAGH
ncbi:LysR family transcriptional regulator [Gallaecimonas mangrovi]|uniref:LysR family transcriptional regulator n=1 Tax=Gallaecimonas mangrovi TaxID=2291597 RepID=UPI000E20BC5A|nr:LysR family transcriptional regulator [Gallaecimonas mangrovi]